MSLSVPKGFAALEVETVRHYTDRLFAFTTERPDSLRFRSGEFLMIGLEVDGKPLVRAYSIASPNWAEKLEFFSIKVEDGPLTSRLQKIVPGDRILIRPKPVGTLVFDALTPGKRLILLSTGTGIAPFASIIRDPEAYDKFERVVLVHTTRERAELQYGLDLVADIAANELLSDMVGDRLQHIAATTREQSPLMGRATAMIEDGRFEKLTGAPLDPETDRVMICGSMAMLQDLKAICEARSFTEGANSAPGQYVIEKAFADA